MYRLAQLSINQFKTNDMNKKTVVIIACVVCNLNIVAQRVGSTPEYIKSLTMEWKGERSPDGRPIVSEDLLERLKAISMYNQNLNNNHPTLEPKSYTRASARRETWTRHG